MNLFTANDRVLIARRATEDRAQLHGRDATVTNVTTLPGGGQMLIVDVAGHGQMTVFGSQVEPAARDERVMP